MEESSPLEKGLTEGEHYEGKGGTVPVFRGGGEKAEKERKIAKEW